MEETPGDAPLLVLTLGPLTPINGELPGTFEGMCLYWLARLRSFILDIVVVTDSPGLEKPSM